MNKKGFTLIEILSALVLIAILSGMAIIGTSSFFKTAEDRYYETVESNILLAGNDYFTDHRDELPTENNFSEISLENLVADKYMEPVKDSDGNLCTEGVVYAYREKNKYKYEVCLKCGNYESSGEYCEERISRDIVVSAKLHGTNTSYDVLKSYNRVSYSDGKDIDVTLSMDSKYVVNRYIIYNTRNSNTEWCNDINSNNSCNYIIRNSGSYKVTAYDDNGNELSTKYINARIAKKEMINIQ